MAGEPRRADDDRPRSHGLRHLHGALPPGRREPHHRAPPRSRADRVARSARLRRGLDRRASFGGLRDHRVAGAVHRRGGGADAAHPARHGRVVVAVPSSVHARRPHGAARPPDVRPHDVRCGTGRAPVRRLHARHRPDAPARDDGRVAGDDPRAAHVRRADHARDRLVHATPRTPAAPPRLARLARARSPTRMRRASGGTPPRERHGGSR